MAGDKDTKHLELIQAIIARLSSNSFTIKGWCITLVSAILGFGVASRGASLALLATLPIILFWGLDSYYLALERLYRARYSIAVHEVEAPTFDLSLPVYESRTATWFRAVRATPVIVLYGALLVVSVAVFAAVHFTGVK